MKELERKKEIVLSLETSVQGGSISLLKNGRVIDSWQGKGSVSKSEDILDELSKILKTNAIEKEQIKQIVVSTGPGSFTGTRIGLSIAYGLKKSLNCEICGISVLKAMALQADGAKKIIAAVRIGSRVCVQEFRTDQKPQVVESAPPRLLEIESFVKLLNEVSGTEFVLNGELYSIVLEEVKEIAKIKESFVWISENLACLIGKSAGNLCDTDIVQPVYVREIK